VKAIYSFMGEFRRRKLGRFMGKKIDDRTESRVPKSALPGLGGGAATGKPPGSFSGVGLFNGPHSLPSPGAREAERLASEGRRLLGTGRPAKAVDVLKKAVELKPDVAAIQLDLGCAFMATGRLQEAAETLALAIRLDGRMPTAHYYLALVFDGFGQEEMAMAGYKAAVALKPDLVDAQMRLGDLYLARDLRADAEAAFRAAASASARDGATARIAEARADEASGDFEAALAKMRAAVAGHPKSGEARAILANLLAQAGLSEEAATEFERASELTLDVNSVWIGITTNRKLTAGDDALIARMQAALDQSRLMPRHRQMLHFALGKAHDDRGEYEAAMRNFEEGNRLRGMGSALDRESLARRVDQIIEATPPTFWDRSPDIGVEDATPILIVGMPRSGSTLTEQILSSHPDVAAGGELGFWSAPQTLSENLWSLEGDAETAKRVANDYIATLRAFDRAAKRVTDKALANFFPLGIIHRILPKATLIHCRRHPIDTALSIFTTNFETNFDYASNRGDLVFYYRQYARLMDHWRSVLPPDRLVEVNYESLVSDPEPHARRLVAACGLDWNDACLAPHRNTRKIKTASVWQARQPIYRTSVERWRRYEPWLGELRELAPEMH
jgi:tetratricopeptide (TPR) repeat protein